MTLRACHPSNIVPLYKMMKGTTRYCSKIYATLNPKDLAQTMDITFPKDGLIQKSFPELFIGWIHTHQDTWMFTCPTVLTVQLPIGQLKVSSHQLQFEIG